MLHTQSKYVVFWLSHYNGDARYCSASTPLVSARHKEFDDEIKALNFFGKMIKYAGCRAEYQSRIPSHVTKSW